MQFLEVDRLVEVLLRQGTHSDDRRLQRLCGKGAANPTVHPLTPTLPTECVGPQVRLEPEIRPD